MTDAPPWGFSTLSPAATFIAGHGLPTDSRSPEAPLDDDAWDRLLAEVRTHRLGGHLVAAVVDGALRVSDRQRAATAALELEMAALRSRYDEVCQPVLDTLDDAGITIRLIKGSALPWTDYPDPQLRPTADLDLLVRGADLLPAVDRLVGLGGRVMNPEPAPGFARRVFKGLTVTMPSGLEVDLHRILSWGPLGVRVPEVDLWAPGRAFDRLGRKAVTLDVERTLIHLAAHLLLLGAVRVSELRDVGQVATSPDLDAERAVSIAERWGQGAVLATALRMAERDLKLRPGSHPLSSWAARRGVSRRDAAWLRIDRPDGPIHGVEPFAVLLELRGRRARATMLRALLAPRPGTDPGPVTRLRALTSNFASTKGPASPARTESQVGTDPG